MSSLYILLRSVQTKPINMLVQQHPTLLDATCWPRLNTMLDDVGLSLNLPKMLASFEQAFIVT